MVGAGVLDLHRADAAGEVPGAEARDGGRLDLAVEAALGRAIGRLLRADQDRTVALERERRRRFCAHLALVVVGKGALQWLLAHADRAGRRVGAGPDTIPGVGAQRLADAHPGAADLQHHAVGG